jgi:hypothetical protein
MEHHLWRSSCDEHFLNPLTGGPRHRIEHYGKRDQIQLAFHRCTLDGCLWPVSYVIWWSVRDPADFFHAKVDLKLSETLMY